MNGKVYSAAADSLGTQVNDGTDAVPRPLRRMSLAVAAVLACGGCATAAHAQATPQEQPQQPGSPPQSAPPSVAAPRPGTGAGPQPPYGVSRWNEDYLYLRDPARRTDFWDPLKYIPLNEAGDWYLSLGAQARYRYERYEDNNVGAGPQDDTGFHLLRGLFHADLHLGPNFRVFAQGKTALEDGRTGGPRPADKDTFDLQQLFADVILPLNDDGMTLTLRGGRQDLYYGAQRLISPLDWTNVRRTFEGGKASLQFSKTHTLDAFVVAPVIVEPEEPNYRDGNQTFFGVYDTIGLPGLIPEANSKVEWYALGLIKTGVGGYPTEGFGLDEDRYTVGVHFSAQPKPFDVDVEGAYQFGKLDGGDINAWMFAGEVGYTLADATFAPRLYVGFDIASGDDDPGDGDSETFNQLFPLAHPYFGFIDLFGRQNIIDVHPGVELTLLQNERYAKKVTLRTDYHAFWRQSDDDAVYNTAGGVLRGDVGGQRFIGHEVDFLLNWQVDRHLAAYAGYSYFFPGDFFDDAEPDEDVDWVYAAVVYTF